MVIPSCLAFFFPLYSQCGVAVHTDATVYHGRCDVAVHIALRSREFVIDFVLWLFLELKS